jgi:dihydrofolate synthase/folylpolyglutamate synthase
MAFLGDSLDKIAFEKAGIMKPGAPCVVGYQFESAVQAGVMNVFHKQSQNLSPDAPLRCFGADWSTAPESGQMLFRYGNDSILLPRPCLAGSHQIWNAGAALEAFRIIAPAHFKPEILSTGLGQIEWPARLQTLKNHTLNALLPVGWDLILDGGHNDSAGLVLATQMEEWAKTAPKPLHLIVGMMARKDAAAFLSPLVPHVRSITLVDMADEKDAFAKEDLVKVAENIGFQAIHRSPDVASALQSLGQDVTYAQKTGRILIAGSLFLAGKVLNM